MPILAPYIQTIKTILIVAAIAAAIWFYKDWQFQKSENIRQTENASQLRKSDSLHYASQLLNSREINDYLDYQNKDLKSKLNKDGIKPGRIESIVSNNYYYRDTIRRESDVSKLIQSIRNGVADSEVFKDTTKCMTTTGKVFYDGSTLKVQIIDREFKNKSDAVAYWERRQWNFLGLKTRFLGKKQFTAKNYNDCGESQIMKIEKKK